MKESRISSVLCVFMVQVMSVVVNVMLFITSVMSPPPDLCDLSVRTVVTMTKFILKIKTSFEAYKRYIYVQLI